MKEMYSISINQTCTVFNDFLILIPEVYMYMEQFCPRIETMVFEVTMSKSSSHANRITL